MNFFQAPGLNLVPVPDFNGQGVLPPFLGQDEATPARSPYMANMREVVAALGRTAGRKEILRGLLDYRGLLYGLGYVSGLQFVDGSFVENKEGRKALWPGDVDVFSYLVKPQAYLADPALWASKGIADWNSEVVDIPKNKARFKVDPYAIAVDHTLQPWDFIQSTIYWYSLFSHQRVTLVWKGFLVVPLDQQDDTAARALL